MSKPWRYKLTRGRAIVSQHLRPEIQFENEWISINRGLVRIRAGYAWDGCSPALRIPGTRIWLGTPDGPLCANGRPVSWEASLFHDALCQFRLDISGLTRAAVTGVFVERLAVAGAPRWMALVYEAGVNLLGPQDFLGDMAAMA